MRRRDFIKVVAGSVAAWPLAAHAQQPGKVPRIGFLGAASPSTFAPRLEAFRLGLRDFGYVEGSTSRSNTAGRKGATSDFPNWRLSWLVQMWTLSSRIQRQEALLPNGRRRRS